MNWYWWALIVLAPFLMYTIFRIVSSAIFTSFFEQKKAFETKTKKED